ncbi:TPA: theronine dehydrogenase, partial [Klebsiella pneumoniae]
MPDGAETTLTAGSGYAVCVDFLGQKQIQRWSDERKAAVRRRNMQARI